MVSRDTLVVAGSIPLALALWYGLRAYTDAPNWLLWAVVLGIGVGVPTLYRERERT